MTPQLANLILCTVITAAWTFVVVLMCQHRFRAQVEAEVERRLKVEREKQEAQRAERDKWILAKVRKTLTKAYESDEDAGEVCAWPVSQTTGD